ncbi:MAG: hypothetical protein JWN38_1035 [Candidatus Saccharibacteria bacterium]|nr:hypothetical protein [Candidatus Saccharibacteria bacterium]
MRKKVSRVPKLPVKRIKLRNKRVARSKLTGWHPAVIPLFTFAVLLALTGIIAAFIIVSSGDKPHPLDAHVVIISHDKSQQVVPSRDRTVGELLKHLDIDLGEGDRVEPALSAPIKQDDFRINIYRAVPVQVVDGVSKTTTFSAATTARTVAAQAHTTVYPEDTVSVAPVEDFIKSGAIGEQVTINRATPVNLNLYGTPLALRTQAKTVADLIAQQHIKLATSDQITPAPTTPLTPETQVFVTRNGVKVESVSENIPTPIQQIQDPTLAYGTSAIRQQGSPGQKVTTYQDTLRNNVVVGRTVLQTVVTQQPVTQIEVVGTSLSGIKGDMALAGIAASDYTYADYIISHESGWCPTKAQGEYGGCPVYSGSVPSYGGYGLCQSTPGSKMASAGGDWATNPVTQLRWCSGYAIGRYGSWAAAYNHWVANHNW